MVAIRTLKAKTLWKSAYPGNSYAYHDFTVIRSGSSTLTLGIYFICVSCLLDALLLLLFGISCVLTLELLTV